MSGARQAGPAPGDLSFDEAEYRSRLDAVRQRMAERGVDVCLISTPENIFYLTGLDHWGYFAAHVLLVPADGEMALVTRAMEKVTIAHQVRNAWFAGHEDHETAADVAIRLLSDRGFAQGRLTGAAEALVEELGERAPRHPWIGLEQWSSGLPYGLAAKLMADLPEARWVDVTGLIDALRLVKSPAEQRCMRAAARVSDAAMAAALDAIRVGASERTVAAECHRAMIEAGGTFPGFGPFIRPSARLSEEHTTWGEGRFAAGDAVFLELSGCVRRYHAPLGRLVFLGTPTPWAERMALVCREAFAAVLEALRPGALAREVYAAWQRVVDAAGLAHYRRHHCGYLVGIGFPPSWTGGNRVTGLRHDSDLAIQVGMSFHILSWLMGTGQGDYFVSDTVLLTEVGPEVLTTSPRDLLLR
jgi:Xaa-Pro dipeptidase